MFRQCLCAFAVMLSLAGLSLAAEYKGMATEVVKGKSITVQIDGKDKTFKINDKTKFIKLFSNAPPLELKDGPGEMNTQLQFTKKIAVELTSKGEKDEEVVTHVYWGNLKGRRK